MHWYCQQRCKPEIYAAEFMQPWLVNVSLTASSHRTVCTASSALPKAGLKISNKLCSSWELRINVKQTWHTSRSWIKVGKTIPFLTFHPVTSKMQVFSWFTSLAVSTPLCWRSEACNFPNLRKQIPQCCTNDWLKSNIYPVLQHKHLLYNLMCSIRNEEINTEAFSLLKLHGCPEVAKSSINIPFFILLCLFHVWHCRQRSFSTLFSKTTRRSQQIWFYLHESQNSLG